MRLKLWLSGDAIEAGGRVASYVILEKYYPHGCLRWDAVSIAVGPGRGHDGCDHTVEAPRHNCGARVFKQEFPSRDVRGNITQFIPGTRSQIIRKQNRIGNSSNSREGE